MPNWGFDNSYASLTLLRSLGIAFLITACGALFVGIQVMFEIRQSEYRRGINLKC